MKRPIRCRRGISLIESIIAAAMFVLVAVGLANLCSIGTNTFARADAGMSARQVLGEAISRMAPTLRKALRVDLTQADADFLAVVVPKRDSSGNLILPLIDGDVIAFYLSDTSGSTNKKGTILWRSVNGVADTAWSLRNGIGQTDLGTQHLSFTYTPADEPESVLISLTTTQKSGTRTVTLSASTETFLRNSRYQMK